MKQHFVTLILATLSSLAMAQSTFTFSTSKRGPVIGPLHYGIFYEEINHAGDGGLYAELIRNGSMEENGSNPDYWWTIGDANFGISTKNLLNSAQRRAMSLTLKKGGDGTRNIGYWGVNIVKGRKYRASFWIRTPNSWKGYITLALESFEGADLGHSVVQVEDAGEWTKYTTEITATGSYQLGWFAIRGSHPGTIYLDCVSLMPPTYKDRPNGMRIDLAEKLEALHPRFMRFPGGCYIEGGNRYQWRHTIGDIETRQGIYNSNWGYPVTNGMGYHEFLQLSEDLGAEPLFVVNVGMGHGWYQNYQHIEGFIQEALEAIEYANGDVNTYWGAKRAAAGHPEPFNLRLLEIGNENYNYTSDGNNDQSDHYAERYYQFYKAIKSKYPDIILIGNSDWGSDYPTWRNPYPLEIIDEHFYRSPDWFAGMYHKYDNYSRSSNKVYNGEYAVTQDFGTNGTLKAALGEAIYMAGMERNSDVCVMASYAPIFMNENESQWRPDMIHYNAYTSFGTPSYWAQQMMSSNVGHQNITWTETGNTIDILHARLGLGSWGTSVTYSNIKVTSSDGTILLDNPGNINSGASMHGTAQIFDVDTYNATIELDAVKNEGDEGFLVAFAYANDTNYAWWNIGGWGNTQHGVEQSANGSKSTLASAAGSVEKGKTYHIKIVREGLTTRCYLDNTLVHTATLSSSAGQKLYLCAALNEAEDTAIVKIINYGGTEEPAKFGFSDATINGTARLRVMNNADNYAENTMENPMNVSPKNSSFSVSNGEIAYTVPAFSLSVMTIPLSDVSAEIPFETATPPAPAISYSFDKGNPSDDAAQYPATLQGDAVILTLDDGNKALYTGTTNGYLDLGNKAAQAIGTVVNGDTYSVSIDILPYGPGHLDSYCWAWSVNNGTGTYIGLINQGGNRDWYFEKVRNRTCRVGSGAGLSQQVWHNITISADASQVRLYIDGKLRGTAASVTAALVLAASTNAWIGRSPFSGDALMTETFFDNLRVYSEALTPEQVRALYNETSTLSTACHDLEPEHSTEPNADALALIDGGTNVDITSLLTNPDFSDGTNGWEGTLFTAAPGTVAEHYYQLFDTYQVLHQMPAGTYRLNWQGFYRNGDIANAHLRYEQGTAEEAEVYASVLTDDAAEAARGRQLASTPLLSIFDTSVPFTYSPYTYPDNVATANEAFSKGYYRQQMDFVVSETSDVRIGLRHLSLSVYDWACVDNFTLTYVGSQTNGLTEIQPIEVVPQGIFDLSGRRINTNGHISDLMHGVYIVNGKKIVR